MKNILGFTLSFLMLFGFLGINSVDAATRVSGYTTKRGTYVAPSYRTKSDGLKYNNYSSKGNYNPYSGKKGYKSW